MGIFKVLFFGNGKKRRSGKVLDLRPKQLVLRVTWKNIPIFLKKHAILVVVFLSLATISFFIVRPFFTRASVAVFYPTNCLGGWENIHNAEGEPQVLNNDPALFNEQNSAYLNNTISQAYCGNFKGTLPQETKPKKIILHLSWAVDKKTIVPEMSGATTTSMSVASSTATSTDTVFIDLNEDFTSSARNAENPLLNGQNATTSNSTSTNAASTDATSTDSSSASTTPVLVPESSSTPSVEPLPTPTTLPVETPAVTPNDTAPVETPPSDTGPVESPQPAPPPPPAPVEQDSSPTSFMDFLIPKVYADELANETTTIMMATTTISETTATTSGTTTATETATTTTSEIATTSPMPAPVDDPVFTILYTLDGKTWNSLGSVTRAEIGNKDFEIPIDNIQNESDLANVQINIQSATTLDQDLTVYLDGMSLSVEYEDLIKASTSGKTFSISGLVSAKTDESLSVNNASGGENASTTSYMFDTTSLKKIENNKYDLLQLADIQIGDRVVVQGAFTGDFFTAIRIIDLAPTAVPKTTFTVAATST